METITNKLNNQSVKISDGFKCTHIQHGNNDETLQTKQFKNYDAAHRWAIKKLTYGGWGK